MQIRRVRLTNVCQFSAADVQFASGMTGILGRNGFGKSNLLNMIYAAFTGDFSCNAGTKDLNIYGPVRDDKKAPSKIEVEFVIGKTTAQLTRALRGDKTRLVVGELDPVYGDIAVTAEICRLLQVSVDMLSDHIFVRQGEIYRGVFDGRETERLKALQQLFQLDWAGTCYQALSRRLTSLPAAQTIDIELMDARIRTAEEDLQAIAVQKQELPLSAPAAQQAITDAQAVVDAYNRRKELQSKLTMEAKQLQQLDADYAALDTGLDNYPVTDTTSITTELDELRAVLTAWERYDDNVERCNAYARKTAQLAELPAEPVPPDGYTPSDEITELIALNSCDMERTVLRQFDSGSTKKCPTCCRDVDEAFSKVLDKFRTRVTRADTLVAKLRQNLVRSKAYEREYATWEHTCKERTRAYQAHIKQGAPVMTLPPTTDRDDAVARSAQLREQLAEHNKIARERRALEAELAELRGQAAQCRQVQQQHADELATIPVAEASDLQHAQQDIQYCRQLLESHAVFQGRMNEARRNLQVCKTQREGARDIAAQQAVLAAQRARLEQLRGAVHPHALPRLFTQRYMHELTVEINQLLESFQVPFTVGIADGLTMFAQHANGTRDSVQRLSGGQKVVLALGFRVAVYRRFARHVGLLVLDEPTEYLDKENIDCLLTALDKVREMVDSDNMQCVVVTHESRLQGTFDKTLVLPAAGQITTLDKL